MVAVMLQLLPPNRHLPLLRLHFVVANEKPAARALSRDTNGSPQLIPIFYR